MNENEIYVYLFTGFLESGKTTLIQGTLGEPEFLNGEKGLLISCEEGEIEYDLEALRKSNVELVQIEDPEELTTDFLRELNKKYAPERVFIEYNGMWQTEEFFQMELPKDWVIVQVLTTVDAGTFQTYMNNMGGMMVQQFGEADAVIFNRCTDDTPKASFRRLVKANNRRAQIIYERVDGTLDNTLEEDMPFDLDAPVIEISEEDYGIWYMDAVEHAEKYKDKTLRFKAVVYRPDGFPEDWFVPGRFAMTCCVDDISFIGFKCHCKGIGAYKTRDWIYITAKARVEYAPEYEGKGVVLEGISVEAARPSKEEIVYFT